MRCARFLWSVLLFSVLLCACSRGKKPPALEAKAAPPVVVESPSSLLAEDVLWHASAKDVPSLASQLLGPMTQPILSSLGFSGDDLKRGGAIRAVVWKPTDPAFGNFPVALLVPFPKDHNVLQELSRALPQAKTESWDKGSILLFGDTAAAEEKHKQEGFAKLLGKTDRFDVSWHVNLSMLWKQFGERIRKSYDEGLKESLAKDLNVSEDRSELDRQTDEIVTQIAYSIRDAVLGTKAGTVGANLNAQGLDLFLITESEKGQLQKAQQTAPDLVQFLPAGDVRWQWNVDNWPRQLTETEQFLRPLLASAPKTQAQFNAWLSSLRGLGQTIVWAGSVSIEAQGQPKFAWIVRVDDGKAAMAVIRRTSTYSTNPTPQELETFGSAITGRLQKNVRKIHGWPVDLHDLTVHSRPTKSKDGDPKSAPGTLDTFSLKFEVVQFDRYLIVAVPTQTQAIADSLLSGKGPERFGAFQHLPLGGSVYVDADASSAQKLLAAARGEMATAALPAEAEVLSFAYFFRGSIREFAVHVPKPLVDFGLGLLLSAKDKRERPNSDNVFEDAYKSDEARADDSH